MPKLRNLSSRFKATSVVVLILLVGAVGLVAQVSPNPLLNSYPLTDQRQIWKGLTPFPAIDELTELPVPGIAQNNKPHHLFVDTGDVDLFGEQVRISFTSELQLGDPLLDENNDPVVDPTYGPLFTLKDGSNTVVTADGEGYPEVGWQFLKEFRELAPGECTFSHNGDRDFNNPRNRQCKAATGTFTYPGGEVLPGAMVAPPLGDLLNPVGLAAERKIVSGQSVTGSAIYVVDQYNQRVQAFDFDGNPIAMSHPIGNGVAGSGTYAYPDGGATGTMLSEPYGIAVDAAGRILVADGMNARIAIFKGLNQGADAGLPAFGTVEAPVHPAIPNGVSGNRAKPNQVVLSRNTQLVTPGTAPLDPNDRIVVTDWTHCTVDVYDAGFNLQWSLPSAAHYNSRPAHEYDHDSCITPDGIDDGPPPTPRPGEFVTLTGAAVDAEGRVYLADHYSNYVQVFDRTGTYLGRIGKPGEQDPPGSLGGVVGLAFDHAGRLAINDPGNARVAFYELEFPEVPEGSNDPGVVATFQFQLDTTIAVDDFAIGFAEQKGADDGLDGLDPKGRFLATDPLRRRVMRFELPELGIMNASASKLTATTGSGSFQVAVPIQKKANIDGVGNGPSGVHPITVTPVQDGCETTLTCIEVGTVVPVSPAPTVNSIAPGQYVQYLFTYATVTGHTMPLAAKFRIQAGSSASAARHALTVIARSACTGCTATHVVIDTDTEEEVFPTPTPNAPVDGWYSNFAWVRISAGDGGVTSIQWWYEGQGALAYQSFQRESALDGGSLDVPVLVDGKSWVKYRAITEDGGIGPVVSVPVFIDRHAPDVTIGNWRYGSTPVTPLAWYNQPLTFSYTATDTFSGVAEPDGSADETFDAEGRNLVKTVFATDYVGHTQGYVTNSTTGRVVNLDMTAPALADEADSLEIQLTGSDELGPYGVVPDAAFRNWVADWVVDPALADASEGSGVNVASATAPGAQRFRVGDTVFNFTVADVAGNVTSVALPVTITVAKAPVTVAMANRIVTYNGNPQGTFCSVTSVTGASLSGVVTYTGVSSSYGPASEPPTNAGTYSAVCAFAGDDHHDDGTDATATLTINKAQAPITWATPADIVFGSALGATQLNATSSVAGTFNYSPAAGTILAAGTGHILSVTLTPTDSTNYLPASATVSINVTKATLTITVGDAEKTYGDADPAFDYSPHDPSVAGTLSRVAGEGAGTYTINGSLTSSNYNVEVIPGTFTIRPRPITITAAPGQGKTYGNADPPLVCQLSSGTLAFNDVLAGACTRAEGETVAGGPYPITVGTLATGNPNYAITFVGADFTIRRRPVTLTVNFVTRMYGDPLVFDREDVTILGNVLGEELNYTFSTNALPTSPPFGAEGAGDYSLFVTLGDNPNYEVAPQATGTLRITQRLITVTVDAKSKIYGQSDPALTWQVTAGNLVNGDQLTGSLLREGGETAGLQYPIHRGTLGNSRYAVTFVGANLTILKATPVITWVNPADIFYGTALGATQLNASVPLPGNYGYSPAAGTVLAPGAGQTLSVTFTPADSTNYNTVSATVAINVLKADQSITFAALADRPFGAPDFGLGATASSALAVSYTATGACTVAGTSVHIVSVGLCTITASQAGDAFYNAAADVTRSFNIAKADQTITFAPLGGKVYGDADFDLGATATSGLTVNYSATGSCTTSGATLHISGIGNCSITATQPGNDSYNAAAPVVQSFNVAPKPLTITPVAKAKVYGVALALTEFTTTGLVNSDSVASVALTSAGSAATAGVAGSPYTITAADATGTGLQNYAVSYGTALLTVSPATLTITSNVPNKVYGSAIAFAGTEFTATGLVNTDTVTSVSLASTGTEATAGVSGSPYVVTVGNAVGSGLANYSIDYVNGSMTVTPKALNITVTPAVRTKTYNTVATFGTNEFVASGLVNGDTVTAVTLTSAGAPAAAGVAGSPYAVVASNPVGTGLGNYSINYSHGTLNVLPATPVITWANPANIVVTTPLGATQLNASTGLPGTYSYTPSAGTLLPGGTHTLEVVFTPADSVNYTTATKTVQITVLNNRTPNAVDDTLWVNATGTATLAVLPNDVDPDGDTLTVTALGTLSPASAGTLSLVGTAVRFTPSASFRTATFTYTISDGNGGTDTATVTVLSRSLANYRTQSQGGWGTKPSGNNPGALLAANFDAVYSSGGVQIGGTHKLTFVSASAVEKFLPAGGTPNVLNGSASNPTTSSAGNFAGQVLALQLSVDLSAAGRTRYGLGLLKLTSSALAGKTVNEVLEIANAVLGGNLAALPSGLSVAALNTIVDNLNNNFLDGTRNNGLLVAP
ncbi:MAG TPA: MBG domain-containing protein [Vicinamibacterales bacterium]|nr:MBG domain-containing protein [Vicinamibacterales bacterium]